MGRFKDITNQKFNHLTAIYYDNNYTTKGGKKSRVWWCKCDCGNKKLIPVTLHNLTDNITTSCGCYKKECIIENNKKYKKKYNDYNLDGEYGIGYTSKGEEFYFDLEDFEKIKDYCWRIHNKGYVACSINKGKSKPKKDILMHILVMNGYNKALDNDINTEIDHVRGRQSRNDNRKSNLRTCTHQENLCNYPTPSHNTSGVTGVSLDNTHNVWKAYITYNGERINLGSFKKFENAVVARKQAEEKYFGAFSYDNSMNLNNA